MRAMKDSGIPWIGEIPKDWSVMPHKRVMYKVKEIQERYNGENILSLTMRGVIVRDLEAGGKMPTSFDGYQKVYPNNLLQCLFDIDVTPRCVGLIRNEGLTSPAYSQFAMYPIGYAPYYDYLLRYMDDRKTLLHLSKNLRSSLTETDFGAIYTCVPSSIEEQQRIAEFLDRKCAEVDEMIALQEQIIEELKAYKQSVITEAVTKGLNPAAPMRDSGIDWIDTIPCHWIVRKMKSLIDLKSGSNLTSEQISEKDDGYPVYGGNGLRGTYSEYSNEGDYVLIGRQGALCGNINYASGKFWVTEHALVCYPKEVLDIRWLGESLRTMNLNQYSLSAAQPGLSAERIKNLYMIVPPTTEQQAIADYLDDKCADIDSLIQTKQSKIDSLKEYKKSIIYEYVTGKKEIL